MELRFIILFIACSTIGCFGCSKQQPIEALDGMVFIPAGDFLMGDSQGNNPRHVSLNSYYIDQYEVTNQQYEDFILAGGYKKKEYWTTEGWNFIQENKFDKPLGFPRNLFDDPDQPIVGVTWYEADAYCRWAGKRLPTEAEWEKAARGEEGYRYPWGNEMNYANVSYLVGGGHRTVPVGSYPGNRSPYGVMDMAGNVAEWCADWYSEADDSQSERNRQGASQGTHKVLRGGSWSSIRLQWQSTYRAKEKPHLSNFSIGFRCARDAH